ncbi:IclR family transcriptional regulator [Pusillimonas noertemannii]|uniref:IclR family transcriptional regulator n=1 Tax=Pusillimonas noertemannii TaxID=305977 RepID=UPI00031F80B0|nr:IclR family transcriptional regulator [Pusillimonas noertemannii]
MKPNKEDRQFVDALARGLAILECLSRVQKPLGNGEIARLVTLPPSTVSRLTYTLTELGYLRRSELGRTYELTPKNLTLGYPLLAGMELRDRLRPHLKSISERTGHTVALAIRDGLHMCFVDVAQGADPNAIRLATGGRLRMSVSAAGIATLAAMPERKRWSILNRLRSELQQRGESGEQFEQALQACFRLGYAVVRNVWQDGIGGISVPIQWKETLAALTMPIPTLVVSKHDMYHELAPVLLAAAEEIGRARIEPVE